MNAFCWLDDRLAGRILSRTVFVSVFWRPVVVVLPSMRMIWEPAVWNQRNAADIIIADGTEACYRIDVIIIVRWIWRHTCEHSVRSWRIHRRAALRPLDAHRSGFYQQTYVLKPWNMPNSDWESRAPQRVCPSANVHHITWPHPMVRGSNTDYANGTGHGRAICIGLIVINMHIRRRHNDTTTTTTNGVYDTKFTMWWWRSAYTELTRLLWHAWFSLAVCPCFFTDIGFAQ